MRFFRVIPVWVVALVTAMGMLASGALSAQAYVSWNEAAQQEWVVAQTEAESRIAAAATDRLTLEIAIANAQALLDSSNGKTLDDATRTALAAEIANAKAALKAANDQAALTQAQLDQQESQANDGAPIWQWLSMTNDARALTLPDPSSIAAVVSAVGTKMTAVKEAQTAWQAEEDRKAEEAAAAARAAAARAAAARAAAERAAAQNQIATTPVGQPLQTTTPPAPVAGFTVESYIAALAPNAFVKWVTGLCQPGYICGQALVGGVKTTPVEIDLDAGLKSSYSTNVGRSVLVHEAAHARQWFTYVGNIISVSEQQSGLVGKPAVEYMADCATIGKYGRSTGAYTSSCTAAQLAAIASIWP